MNEELVICSAKARMNCTLPEENTCTHKVPHIRRPSCKGGSCFYAMGTTSCFLYKESGYKGIKN